MKNVIVTLLTLLLFCCLQANGQDYLKLANDCFEKGDYECAKRNYTLFQTFDGSNMSAQIQNADECMKSLILADNYFKEEEWEKARDRYKILLEINPKDPHAQKQFDLCEERLKAASEISEDVADKNDLEEEENLENEEIQQVNMDENEAKPAENVDLPVQYQTQADNLKIKKRDKSNRADLLFTAGGVCIAGGITASLLLSKRDTKLNDGRIITETRYSLLYASVGIVVGGLCFGSGAKIKKKESIQPLNTDISYNHSHSPSNRNSYSILNFVVYGNEAGLRLTF